MLIKLSFFIKMLSKMWQPIFEEEDSKIVSLALKQIMFTLISRYDSIEDNGLMNGKAGLLLFLTIYKKHFSSLELNNIQQLELNDIQQKIISSIYDNLDESINQYSLADGLCGVSWLLVFLMNNNLVQSDSIDIFNDLDNIIFDYAKFELEQGKYDYLHNGLGGVLYFLARYPHPGIKQKISTLINILHKTSVSSSKEMYWLSEFSSNVNKNTLDLSMSHGLAGILRILNMVYDLNIEKILVSSMLTKISFKLLNFLNISTQNVSLFPDVIAPDVPIGYSTRIAWCYGDLTIAYALIKTGISLRNKYLYITGSDIVVRSTLRKSYYNTKISDIGVCHGSSGVAHIYNRLFQETNQIIYKENAKYWLSYTIDNLSKSDKKYLENKSTDICFLEGTSGVGLTLLAAYINSEPNWDRCILLS